VYQSGKPLVYLAVPLMAGLSIAHGFLPPHPSPTAIVPMFGANMGLTLIIAGPIFALTVKKIEARPADLFTAVALPEDALPGAFNSFVTALLPVILLTGATAITYAGHVDA